MRHVLRGAILIGLLALPAAPAHAQSGIASYVYERCLPVGEVSVVDVVGAPCAEAEALAAQLVAAPPEGAAGILATAGWTALRARATSSGSQHDLVALRGAASLRIRRSGPAPDLDGWQAGRELIFARPRLVPGGRAPSGAALCTSAFLVRFSNRSFGGLSAAHCGGLRSDGTVHRRNVALRRPPQFGIVLGRVQRILTRTRPYDALVVPVPSGVNRSRVPVVDRGVSRPPWRVVGPAQPLAGRAVCYAGRTSGIDQCGSIAGRSVRRAERLLSAFAGVVVRCTTMRARQGDSGGPVYTAPRADGSVRAVGIVTLVVGSAARMCFTPLGPVLDGLNASLVSTAG
jgi:hypothetical protein